MRSCLGAGKGFNGDIYSLATGLCRSNAAGALSLFALMQKVTKKIKTKKASARPDGS